MLTQNVAVAIFIREQKILLSKRPNNKPFSGYWEFPGGKQHDNETSEEALVRECQEELGTIVTSANLVCVHEHQYDATKIKLHVYRVINFQGEPKSCEGQDLQWFAVPELQHLNLLPANFALLKLIDGYFYAKEKENGHCEPGA